VWAAEGIRSIPSFPDDNNTLYNPSLCVKLYLRKVKPLLSLRRADHSSRGVLPTVACRCVWSRNLDNEEAMSPGRCCPKKREKKASPGLQYYAEWWTGCVDLGIHTALDRVQWSASRPLNSNTSWTGDWMGLCIHSWVGFSQWFLDLWPLMGPLSIPGWWLNVVFH
jgi:hypothetical protein